MRGRASDGRRGEDARTKSAHGHRRRRPPPGNRRRRRHRRGPTDWRRATPRRKRRYLSASAASPDALLLTGEGRDFIPFPPSFSLVTFFSPFLSPLPASPRPIRVRVYLEEPAILSLYMDIGTILVLNVIIYDSVMCIMFISSSEHNNHM